MDLTELLPVSHNAGSGKVLGRGMENRRRLASLSSLAESQQVLDVIIFKKILRIFVHPDISRYVYSRGP